MTAHNVEEYNPCGLWAVIDRPYIGNRIHSQPAFSCQAEVF
jgi:hypothetical protein